MAVEFPDIPQRPIASVEETVTPDLDLAPVISNITLGKLSTRYLTEVKAHSASETLGVVKQLRRLIDQGLTLAQIERAITLYRDDPWRKADPQRRSRHIRSFFTKDMILAWQQPFAKQKRASNIDTFESVSARTPRPAPPRRRQAPPEPEENWEL